MKCPCDHIYFISFAISFYCISSYNGKIFLLIFMSTVCTDRCVSRAPGGEVAAPVSGPVPSHRGQLRIQEGTGGAGTVLAAVYVQVSTSNRPTPAETHL